MVCADFGVVDWGCNEEFTATVDDSIVTLAENLAVNALHALSGFAVGPCPVKVRPCSIRCSLGNGWRDWSAGVGGQWVPYISHGQWINGCGCVRNDCSCTELSTVRLPGPVGEITEVRLDGVVLDPTEYVVYNGTELVRRDGVWPACQDLRAADTEPDTFSVTYVRGVAADDTARYVAGLLAFEFAQACLGSECQLPAGVTNLVRPGITVEITNGLFPEGRTGIPAVDAWIRSVNPYAKVNQITNIVSANRPRTRREG